MQVSLELIHIIRANGGTVLNRKEVTRILAVSYTHLAPAVQMPRGGPKYCAFEAEWENCKMAATGTVCISEDGKCGTGVEVGAPGEGSGEGGNHGAPTN